jgi:hypothetical protein
MTRLQRPRRDPKPRPAPPTAAPRRKPTSPVGKSGATAKLTSQPTAKLKSQPTAKSPQTQAKSSLPTGKPGPTATPAAAALPSAAIAAQPVTPAPAGGETQAADRPPRRGLGNLGRQSLHRQLPTITLAVERPRVIAAAPAPAYRASSSVVPAGPPAPAAMAGLLQLRDGLRGLLSLLDAPKEAAKM